MANKLSIREAKFVQAYVAENGNATKAAESAGYSAKSAARIGYRLTNRVHVREAIEKAQGKLATKAGYTAEKVISELATIADAIPKKITASEKLKALELLGKAQGMFKDGKGESRVTVNIGFLQASKPADEPTAIEVQVTSAEPAVMPAVMPPQSQVALPGGSSDDGRS